jgi:hypothetical protein
MRLLYAAGYEGKLGQDLELVAIFQALILRHKVVGTTQGHRLKSASPMRQF